jgi:hypothetical protein
VRRGKSNGRINGILAAFGTRKRCDSKNVPFVESRQRANARDGEFI